MLRQSLVIALVAVAAAGCASQQVSEEAQPSSEAPAATSAPAATGAQPSPSGQPAPAQSGSQQAARSETGSAAPASQSSGGAMAPSAARSIYYDFDKSIVKDEFKSVIESHGGYLAGHPGAKVTIEGNCDERGSREYNLALGQRRADSVKGKLKLLGVSEGQIETVSWGKEKPKVKGHNEAAWAENRRSDIVYTRMQ
jgi:peptidoglycan-associated lipoprotein